MTEEETKAWEAVQRQLALDQKGLYLAQAEILRLREELARTSELGMLLQEYKDHNEEYLSWVRKRIKWLEEHQASEDKPPAGEKGGDAK
jgi:hypothetical protein